MDKACDITWVFPDGSKRVTDGYRALNLLGHGEIFDIRIPQACGGQAECGTCRVRLLGGELTPISPPERELRERHHKRFMDAERLSCQGRPRGDIVIELLGIMPPDLRDEEDVS